MVSRIVIMLIVFTIITVVTTEILVVKLKKE